MFHFLSLLGGLALFSSATAQTTWMVGVGTPVGDNVFNPSYLNATRGDTIRFNFFGDNHTVTQSTLASPCDPRQGGFDSGFILSGPGSAVHNGKLQDVPSFNVTVVDDQPIYVHCRQDAYTPESHCAQGMVFAVNPGDTFGLFLENALNSLHY
jgi:plastocyanin